MKKYAKKIIKWLTTTKLLAFPRIIAKRVIYYAISYEDPNKLKVITLLEIISNEQEVALPTLDACQLFMAVKATAKVVGDIAEVGVYKGGSAKLICEAKGNKTLHLFDTFEGLPDLCEVDDPRQFQKGQYLGSFENVKTYLKPYSNVCIYKGLFPSTAEPIKNKRFSLVNLDVDLYESTLSCLEFFYTRMNKGGVIISHDYSDAPGVRKAFDEFFEEKPEPIIELSLFSFGRCSQCLVIKC